ncbi:hypothetical protein PybrP1_003557 [[Pythium] brassicae (nom. inval.)]|nr:hypothetical protein PybrP1_003557 [[Pythium] brassicae (nom. inval.)]
MTASGAKSVATKMSSPVVPLPEVQVAVPKKSACADPPLSSPEQQEPPPDTQEQQRRPPQTQYAVPPRPSADQAPRVPRKQSPVAQPRSNSGARPTASSGTGEAGDIVGEYALGETIGKGTFGKVKIGLHLPTGEKVAIKILEKKRIVQIADVERVAREIKILKRNRHLNVIQVRVDPASRSLYAPRQACVPVANSVQDLIRKILETNPEKRYTVELIRQHPWFTSMRAVAPKALAERDDSAIKESVLNQLEMLGFSKADAASAIQKSVHNSVTASYYLLYGKLTRLMKEHSGNSSSLVQAAPPVLATLRGGAALPPQQPLPSAPESSSPTAKKVGSLGAVANTGCKASGASPTAVNSTGAYLPPSQDGTPRRHSTQPSHYKESATRAATPSGASPRHPHHQHQHLQFSGQPGAPSPYSQQPRRPSSVRGGRTLVLLTNDGAHHPANIVQSHNPPSDGGNVGGAVNSLGVVPVPPRDRRPSGLVAAKAHSGVPSSGASATGVHQGSRVSVTNGMVALSPLAHHPHQQHQRREGSDAPASQVSSRRHTLESSQHAAASPRSTGAASGATSALTKAGGGSTTNSSIVARRRITLQPGTSLGLESAPAATRAPVAADEPHSITHGAVGTSAATTSPCLKEDDSREPRAASSARIQAPAASTSYHRYHHPQPPTRPSPAHVSGVM